MSGSDGEGSENGNGSKSSGSQLATLMRWADERRDLRVLANADTPEDAAVARRNGAEGCVFFCFGGGGGERKKRK